MLSERQQQIIQESIKLIDTKGIQGFTIKNLSKEIGISEPGIYRHFESKFAILAAILDSFMFQMQHFKERFVDGNKNALKKIENIYISHFQLFTKNPAIISVIFAEEIFHNDKILYNKINEILKMNENLISQIIEKGQKANEIKSEINKNQITIMLMGSLRLIVKRWKMSSYAFDLMKEGKELLNSINSLIKK